MTSLYDKISKKIDIYFNSNWFNYIINALTLIDCTCVLIVLTLEYIELSLINKKYLEFSKLLTENAFSHNYNKLIVDKKLLNKFITDQSKFEIAHVILTSVILTILGLFIIEIVLKLIFTPRIFLKQKFEIIEAIVIVISFALDLTLLFGNLEILSIISLATLIRLWRIGLIVNGKNFCNKINY